MLRVNTEVRRRQRWQRNSYIGIVSPVLGLAALGDLHAAGSPEIPRVSLELLRLALLNARYDEKVAMFRKVEGYLKRRKLLDAVKVIDLNFGNRVFIRGDFFRDDPAARESEGV